MSSDLRAWMWMQVLRAPIKHAPRRGVGLKPFCAISSLVATIRGRSPALPYALISALNVLSVPGWCVGFTVTCPPPWAGGLNEHDLGTDTPWWGQGP